MPKKSIARRIKYYRRVSDYTQESLAEILNSTRSTISSWERGTNTPDIFTLIELTKLFNITLSQLVGENEKDYALSAENDPVKEERLFNLHKQLELLSDSELDNIEFAFKLIEERRNRTQKQ